MDFGRTGFGGLGDNIQDRNRDERLIVLPIQGIGMNHTDTNFGIGSTSSGPLPTTSRSLRAAMPDVASDQSPEVSGNLQRVGMSGIELMIRWQDQTRDQETMRLPATADAYVSLDDDGTKGIHMSRLYLALTQRLETERCSIATLRSICEAFLASHAGISQQAELGLQFSLPAWRAALLSDHSAPRHYPVQLRMVRTVADGEVQERVFLRFQVVYSSTCPCSAALSRQLLQQKFQDDFAFHRWVSVSNVEHWLGQNGSLATPHSQRSIATIDLEWADPGSEISVQQWIEEIETALQTAVQAVVKRQDEQEFARLNGANQMFCEDAARRLKAALEPHSEIRDYRVEARHMESLHPHDATAIAVKGIPDGMRP